MRFLLDENFPKSARSFPEAGGHEVIGFRTEGRVGAPDTVVIALAKQRAAVVLKGDRDFFHTLGRQHPEHHGIVVIALKKPTRNKKIKEAHVVSKSCPSRKCAWTVFPTP